MKSLSPAIPALLTMFLLTAAGEAPPAAPAPLPAEIVAQRGDVRLTRGDLQTILANLDPNTRTQVTATPKALAAFARERLLNNALLAEAHAQGWESKPEIAHRLEDARETLILQTYLASKITPDPLFPSEADITKAYEENRARLFAPKQFHVAQIVLLVKPGASAAEEEEARKHALDLRAQIVRAKADFGDVARKNSQEKPSAANGGDVGWVREPDLIPAARDALNQMQDGAVSQPVRMPGGWHLIKLLEVKPSGPIPLLDAKPQLVQALRQARAQAQMRAYIDTMMKTQPIEVNEIEVSKAAGGQ